jgi:hypothetical protein
LKDVIGDILGHTNAKVTAPIAASIPTNIDYAPYSYLIRNISTEDAAKLTLRQCWATTHIGFLVYTAEAIMPSYLGAIQGFSMTDDDDTSALLDLVRRTFRESEISSIISGALEPAPAEAGANPMKRAHDIIDTLAIRVIHIRSQGGSLRPFANLYLKWPVDNDEAWSQLIAVVANTSYQDSLLGFGSYYAGWTCTICHGADHPSGLCPLPLLPGWIMAAPILPVMEYRNQFRNTNSRNTGQRARGQNRGRGSGRGSNSRNTNTPRGQKGFNRGRGISN